MGRRTEYQQNLGATIVAILIVAGCGDSRDAESEETVPRITPVPTVAQTTVATTVAPTTTAAPTTPATTNPINPTTPPVPPTNPTVPPTPAPTNPPTAAPTNPPTAAPTTPPTAAPTNPTDPPSAPTNPTVPPTPGPPATTAGPTSTVVVDAETPPVCSGDGIGADTGDLLIADVSCVGGWATGRIDECSAGDECGLDVFHITAGGWVYDGNFPAECAEGLTAAGMSIYTAAQFVTTLCVDEPGAPSIIRPGSTGGRVVQLQIALLGEGYRVSADGTYGPRTQAAVRDFQAANGLEVDGIAGPQTQAALGIGRGGPGPTTAAPPPATVPVTTAAEATATTAAPTTAGGSTTTSTVVLEPGEPAECSVDTIGAESGTAIAEVIDCQAGWAFGRAAGCTVADGCIAIDLFHFTDAGWAYDGKIRVDCAEDLAANGVSIYTAIEFGPVCGPPPPDQPDIIRPGSSGDDVENLQIALLALGYPVAVDDTYGARTQAAVRNFQAANGLEVDGIAGPQTRVALGV